MPNETSTTSSTKRLTGSSKRKRKHSIKRNILLDDNSNCNDPAKSKIEKTYSKRSKVEKSKTGEDMNVEIKQEASELLHESFNVEENVNETETKTFVTDNLDKNINITNTDSASTQCTSSKQQCQNCKFCSQHEEKEEEEQDKQTTDKKKFICEICAKDGSTRVYNSVEKHKHHLATVHEIFGEEIKRFVCRDCPGSVWFPTKSKFTYHVGTKHPGIMRFVCEVCTETFLLKANYKTHMKTHNIVVQKKFSCDVCNGTFVNKAGYEAHKRRFPGPHIKQSCVHCGFSFSKEKHMRNHRCKTLLLEEAAARVNQMLQAEENAHQSSTAPVVEKSMISQPQVERITEDNLEANLTAKDPLECDPHERVVFHRIIPSRRNQEQSVYRPVQMQNQSLPESVVVQELREIDLENGTFITTSSAPNEPEQQQFIVRDVNGHILQGNQILQLDINDVQQGEENQVFVADWNIVAPYVIREKSP